MDIVKIEMLTRIFKHALNGSSIIQQEKVKQRLFYRDGLC